MKQVSLFLSVLILSAVAFALPQTVQMTGSFQSRHGGVYDVTVNLKLKKEANQKARYTGSMTFVGQVLNKTQGMELTMNAAKNKSASTVNTYDGYIAFDSKSVYNLDLGQQLQLGYSQFVRQQDNGFCNPIFDNFCRPGQMPDRLADEGVLTLTVVQAQ